MYLGRGCVLLTILMLIIYFKSFVPRILRSGHCAKCPVDNGSFHPCEPLGTHILCTRKLRCRVLTYPGPSFSHCALRPGCRCCNPLPSGCSAERRFKNFTSPFSSCDVPSVVSLVSSLPLPAPVYTLQSCRDSSRLLAPLLSHLVLGSAPLAARQPSSLSRQFSFLLLQQVFPSFHYSAVWEPSSFRRQVF